MSATEEVHGAVSLTRRLTNGEVSALAELYDRYADSLHDFAFSVLRDGDQAGDVVHDVLLTAARHAGELRDPERLEGWLFALAREDVVRRAPGPASPPAVAGERELMLEPEAEPDDGLDVVVTEPAVVVPPPVQVEVPPLPGDEPQEAPDAEDEVEEPDGAEADPAAGPPTEVIIEVGGGAPSAGARAEPEAEVEPAPEPAPEPEREPEPVPAPPTVIEPVRSDDEREREALWLDAASLPARTRVVLDLSLRQDLGGRTLADAIGVRPPQVDSVVEREQQRAVTELGAMAVARQAPGGCPDLDALLGSSPTPKQLVTHVDRCPVCADNRRSVPVLTLLAGVPRLPAPAELRDQVLADHDRDVVPPVPLGPDGFPRGRPVRTLVALALAVAVLIALVGVAIAVGSDDDEPELVAVTTTVFRPSTTATTPSTTATTLATTTTVPTTAPPPTVAGAAPAPGPVPFSVDTSSVSFGGGGSSAALVLRATGGTDVSWRSSSPVSWLQVQPASGVVRAGTRSTPTVQLLRARAPEGDIGARITVTATSGGASRTFSVPVSAVVDRPPAVAAAANPGTVSGRGCGGVDEASVGASISEESGLTSVTLRWTHADGTSGQRTMSIRPDGVWEGTLGPFRNAGDVRWQVVATDGRGNVGGSESQTLTVAGC